MFLSHIGQCPPGVPKLLLCGHMYAYVYVCACMPLRLLTNTQVKSNLSLKFKCACVTKRFLVIRPRLRDFLENAINFNSGIYAYYYLQAYTTYTGCTNSRFYQYFKYQVLLLDAFTSTSTNTDIWKLENIECAVIIKFFIIILVR